MNKGCKITLIVISIVFLIILVGGYFALKTVRSAFGSECSKSKSWTVQGFEIQEYSCLGWAGPRYYPLSLYKNGKKVGNNGIRKDSCTIIFKPKDELYLYINTCNNSLKEIRPNKKLINISKIDSAFIYSKGLRKQRKLTKNQIKKIADDWNKADVLDYRDKPFDSLFYPYFDYKLILYINQSKRELITGGYLIADDSKWTYIINQEKYSGYFNEIWSGR